MRFGTQLKIMPARVMAAPLSGLAGIVSAASVPAGASPSSPASAWACPMAPSAVSTAKTPRPPPSGEKPIRAVATAPASSEPGTICSGRLVTLPAKRPPKSLLNALAKGSPVGSSIDSVPMPPEPYGALANHTLPKALLIEMPSGLLTLGYLALAAPGVLMPLMKAGLCAA